jgi:hypothetical protein
MDLSNHLPVVKAVEAVLKQRPHVQTCRRWVKKGCRGIRLQAQFVNGTYQTTIQAVEDFIRATTAARLESVEAPSIEVSKPVNPARVAAAVAEFNRMTKPGKAKA